MFVLCMERGRGRFRGKGWPAVEIIGVCLQRAGNDECRRGFFLGNQGVWAATLVVYALRTVRPEVVELVLWYWRDAHHEEEKIATCKFQMMRHTCCGNVVECW